MSTKPLSSSAASTASRPSIVQLVIKEKGELYAAYIPLFKDGGIFISATRDYKLGDDVYILLTLPDETQRYPVTGKVAWITPAHAAGNQTQGIGVKFPSDEKSILLKAKIEEILGSHLASNRPTHTI
ncbi:PilZ domain-containing protein [Polaromonas sp.]|uniref:PilZ domain-containing protein n=1 Tax=Polaromonas sp. TaxID=1869339 RepID=UPI001A2EF16E|nr:PilZ domain-containing protein [Burkholderiales bacterium]MBH2018089.1 PilZ domain-containing protein [Burkholderiales bacterium]